MCVHNDWQMLLLTISYDEILQPKEKKNSLVLNITYHTSLLVNLSKYFFCLQIQSLGTFFSLDFWCQPSRCYYAWRWWWWFFSNFRKWFGKSEDFYSETYNNPTYLILICVQKPEVINASRKYRIRVLVCAPSNSALDEIVLRLLTTGMWFIQYIVSLFESW